MENKNNSKRNKKIIFIVVVISLLVCVGVIGGILANFFFGGEEYETKDIKEYGVYSGHIEKEESDLFSHLMIFPKKILDSAQVEEYYYYCDNYVLDNAYQLYLVQTLNESDYDSEVKRLSEISIDYQGFKHSIIYDEDGFQYPAYVTIFDSNGNYEYALTDEVNQRIIYVFTQLVEIEEKGLNKDYIPQTFSVPEELRHSERNGYHMYYFYNEHGDGSMPEVKESE